MLSTVLKSEAVSHWPRLSSATLLLGITRETDSEGADYFPVLVGYARQKPFTVPDRMQHSLGCGLATLSWHGGLLGNPHPLQGKEILPSFLRCRWWYRDVPHQHHCAKSKIGLQPHIAAGGSLWALASPSDQIKWDIIRAWTLQSAFWWAESSVAEIKWTIRKLVLFKFGCFTKVSPNYVPLQILEDWDATSLVFHRCLM